MAAATLFLKPGREKSVLQRHPWVFSGAVERMEGSPEMGETVRLCSASGDFVGWAAFSPKSQIRARLWLNDPNIQVGPDYLHGVLKRSLQRREWITQDGQTDAVRLVHAESDGFPGLIVDRYRDMLVIQILSAGAEHWREEITRALVKLTGLTRVYERSDVDVRKLEGLPERTGVLVGSEPDARIEITENGLRFWVDVRSGHKTGFYLDQRDNRARLMEWARGREVLNCFAYSGAFSVYALAGGAERVLSVDTSAEALSIGKENIPLNGLPPERAEWLEGDVFYQLRSFRDSARSFDLIILDPPKFAYTAAQVERAARGYKDINLLAFKLLRPGGILFTFSCSGAVSADLFQKIVAGAALDAGANGQILASMTQGPDHPVGLNFPEGAYLKGLVVSSS